MRVTITAATAIHGAPAGGRARKGDPIQAWE